jgi:hypothetical protein
MYNFYGDRAVHEETNGLNRVKPVDGRGYMATVGDRSVKQDTAS